MKIAFLNITQNLVGRGAETFVLELSVRLRKNHEVVVFGGDAIPPHRWPIIWRFFIDPNSLYILLWTIKLIPAIWKEKFDVVIPLNGGWQPALVRLVTWLYRGKMIISGQSGMGWDDRNNLWSFPDAFVALSSRARGWARKVNPFVGVEYVPNGVDIKKFNTVGKKRRFSLERPIVLCVAALTPNKRVDLAIRAVAKTGEGSLLVVGDGELRHKIYDLGIRLLGKRFHLIKAKFNELPDIYRSVDVFTLPSESFQSFEIVLVEAMATNLPVVANDDPIRREIVGESGILVNPIDLDSYTEALKKVLDTKWSDRPRKQAEKFSWDKISEQYEELFEKVK